METNEYPETLTGTHDDFDGTAVRLVSCLEALRLGLPAPRGERVWVQTPEGYHRQYHYRHLLGAFA